MSQIVVYFLHSTAVLSFYKCSLDTFYLKPGFVISSLIDYLFGPKSFENKDLDINCFTTVAYHKFYCHDTRAPILTKRKIWQQFVKKSVSLLSSKYHP